MKMNKIVEILKVLTTYFHQNKIPYVIVGGLSVITWGRIRATEDIDIIIDHNVLNIKDFVDYLQEHGFYAEIEDFKGFQEQSHCSILEKESLFRIDFVGKYTRDKEISINEAKEVIFQGIKLKMDSPENLIAHKLKFGADFDIEDAIAVLVRYNENLDVDILKKHAERLGIQQKLRNVIQKIVKQNKEILSHKILSQFEIE